jgi:hypothetical protein
LLRREDLHLLKSHTISAARRVGGVIGMEIAVGEVGGIAEPPDWMNLEGTFMK